MPARSTLASAVALMAIALAIPAVASNRGVPVTTSSPEARQLYLQAQEKADNLELPAAAKLIDQAIEKDPDFAMAYLLRANASSALPVFRENLDKAVALADKVSPGERELILASKAQADGDLAATKRHLDTVSAQFPSDKRVVILLARYERAIGNHAAAAASFRRAAALDPTFAPAFNDLGYAQMAVKNFAGAEASFRKYITLLPDRPNPYDSYGEMLMKVGRYNESIAQYRKALQKDPGFVSSLQGIGTNQVLRKEYAAARETFEEQRAKASDLDGQLTAMANIAMAYVDEGDRAKAVGVYDDMTARASEGGLAVPAINAQLDAARVLADGGDAAAAMPHVQRAQELVDAASLPPSVTARRTSAITLARAQALAAQGQFAEAHTELDKARAAIEQRQNPGELRGLYTAMGAVANRQKQYKEALALLKKGDDQDPYTLYQLALAYEGLGQANRAAATFAAVAKSNVNDLGYALVRSEATGKASAQPVATAGHKVPVKKR